MVHFISTLELCTLPVFYVQTEAEMEMQTVNDQLDQDLDAVLAEVLDIDWDLNE